MSDRFRVSCTALGQLGCLGPAQPIHDPARPLKNKSDPARPVPQHSRFTQDSSAQAVRTGRLPRCDKTAVKFGAHEHVAHHGLVYPFGSEPCRRAPHTMAGHGFDLHPRDTQGGDPRFLACRLSEGCLHRRVPSGPPRQHALARSARPRACLLRY